MYTIDHIFPVLLIKHLVNHNVEPTLSHKLSTGTKPSVSNLRVFFRLLYEKQLLMLIQINSILFISHNRVFGVYLLEFQNIKKGDLIYVPNSD